MGSGAASFLKLLVKNFDLLAGPVVSLVFPLYASIRAIETKSAVDDQQWLTYWATFLVIREANIHLLVGHTAIQWSCLCIRALREALLGYAAKGCQHWYAPRIKDNFSKPDDILTAAENYIQENGSEAFEKMINRSRESTTTMTEASNYTFYNDHSYVDDYINIY